ncbi:autotransporter domain-containing protein [Bradyrhizobium sp. INPA03-11B]|uniref:autotransporter outer membrane beta-barrel domain-containing protein n=1 Tax=Bradyrhizobium sp. INPA03-11B TaxID=418598 RepID=UPI00338E3190
MPGQHGASGLCGRRTLASLRAGLLASVALLVTGLPAAAQDATWSLTPTAGGPYVGMLDFNSAANWTPATVPTGTATFGVTNSSNVGFLEQNTSVGGWTFNAGASAYTFNVGTYFGSQSLTFNGAGIVGNGGSATIYNEGGFAAVSTTQFVNASTAGSATIYNSGILLFSDSSSAGSATIVTDDLTQTATRFSNTSTAGNAAITNNWSLQFGDSSTAGNARILNNALLDFFNASTAGNATITDYGNLVFHDTSTAGNATITTNNTGTYIQNSASGGTARFILNKNGALDISGLTTGGTTAGSIEGGGSVRLGAKTLTVGGNDLSTAFSGIVSGSGGLIKVGSGTLALLNIANSYAGPTTINGGTLEVDGATARSPRLTVNSGGTLSGIGAIHPVITTIASGGTLAPGNAASPTGTLYVGEDLAFQSGALYLVQVMPSAAASTHVRGTATLGGATVNAAFANGSYISKQYTILTAGSVSGTFGALTNTNLPANFSDTLSYDAGHAYLNLTLNFAPPPPPPPQGPTAPNFGSGLNLNQQPVANALVNSFNTTGGIPMVYGTLTPAGLTQASGELATGSQQTTFDATNLFLGLLTDPLMNRNGGIAVAPGTSGYAEEGDTTAYAATRKTNAFAMFTKAPPVPFVPRWSVWAAGYGGSQSTNGNAIVGSNDTTSSVYGTAVGADYLFSPNTIAGFALAGGGTSFSVVNSGSGRSDLFQAGAYIRHTEGAAYISAALAYGWQDITTNRTVTVAGIDQLRAEFSANSYSGRLEGGYRFVAPWIGGIGITPYAAGQFTTFDLPGHAEQAVVGSSAFALAYAAKSVTDVRSELGLRTDKSFATSDGVLTLRTRFAWAHDYDPDRSTAATFQALPGASFVVNGAAQASDSALTTAAVEMKWRNGWSAAATFEGEFSNVTSSYAGKGGVRYTW